MSKGLLQIAGISLLYIENSCRGFYRKVDKWFILKLTASRKTESLHQ